MKQINTKIVLDLYGLQCKVFGSGEIEFETDGFDPSIYHTNQTLREALIRFIFKGQDAISIVDKSKFLDWIGGRLTRLPEGLFDCFELAYFTSTHTLNILQNRQTWMERVTKSKDEEVINWLESLEQGSTLKMKFTGLEGCPKLMQELVNCYSSIRYELAKSECADELAFDFAEQLPRKKMGGY